MKNYFGKLKNKLLCLYNKNKKLFCISCCLILILLFAVFSYSFSKKETNIVKSKTTANNNFFEKDYESILETKIEELLLSIDEVNSVSVMVVCESTVINNYLKDLKQIENSESNSKTIEENIVFEKSGSNSTPILISSKMPKVVGVLVVINKILPSTKLSIINSLSVVLNIDSTCISILQES